MASRFRRTACLRSALVMPCSGTTSPSGAFATIIGPVFFPSENPSTVLLAAFATYGTALIIRPSGPFFSSNGRSSRTSRRVRANHSDHGGSDGGCGILARL